MHKKCLKALLSVALVSSLLLGTACGKSQSGEGGSSGTLDNSGSQKDANGSENGVLDSDATGDDSQAGEAVGASSENGDADVKETDSKESDSNGLENADSSNGENSSSSEAGLKAPESETELFEFMEGEWNLVNPVTGEDYAYMDIAADGTFSYGYIDSDEKCTGSFSPNHTYAGEESVPLSLSIEVSGLDKIHFSDSVDYIPDDGKDSSNGKIYYGSCEGEDYFFLEETGNGDSFIVSTLFQDPTTEDGSFYLTSYAFMMHRKSADKITVKDSGEDFYAWIWKADDKGIWAQEMKELSWNDENEYTNKRFTAAGFEPAKMESAYYEYTDKVDKRLILNGQRLDMKYPRMMCKLSTDENGKISSFEEISKAYYGIYDMGDIEPEISYEGMTLTYNGVDFDLSDLGAGNAIMDVRTAYGKVIVECHVSPHISSYHIFDTSFGDFSPTPIEGTNLIWLGDDFSTAIYAQWNEVRDLCGDLMFSVEGDEIQTLEFLDDGKKVKCSYYVDNYDDVKEEVFEMPDRLDGAMSAYCDYVSSARASDFRRFMEYAPEDAEFFVITDPQKWFTGMNNFLDDIEPSAFNNVMIVALHNNTVFDISNDNGKCIEPQYLEKGGFAAYKMTVSESMPLYDVNVTIDSPDDKITAKWPVVEFSGETYQHCKFITASGD